MRKKKYSRLQSDFIPTKARKLAFSYRIRWQMITSVNLKPNRSNIDRLRGGAIPPYGVTTRKTRRVVGRSQVGLLLTLIRTIHQLLAACKKWCESTTYPLPEMAQIKTGCIILCI